MAIEPRKPPSQFIPKLQRTLGGRAGWSGFVLQLLFVAALAWISYEIVANARANLQAQRITAEELGITQKNVDEKAKSDNPELKRVLGSDGNLGEQLGLTKDWVVRIVKAVGNYGESFDRNVGPGSKLGIARGLNNLWNKGGIQYAPPIR